MAKEMVAAEKEEAEAEAQAEADAQAEARAEAETTTGAVSEQTTIDEPTASSDVIDDDGQRKKF
jgi:hypothetical protein